MADQVHHTYLEGRILAADPLTLVCILYDSALRSVQKAREMLEAGDIPARSKAISKAFEALDLLAASLNLEEGGELGGNLLELYLYMEKRLLEANIQQSDSILEEVQSLLAALRESWARLASADSPSSAQMFGPIPPHNELTGPSAPLENPEA